MPLYVNEHDFPNEKYVSYTWATLWALVFGWLFWFHTVRWRILGVYFFLFIMFYAFIPEIFLDLMPRFYGIITTYLAILAPRICHERWKRRGYTITDLSYAEIPLWYESHLRTLYKLPSFGLF